MLEASGEASQIGEQARLFQHRDHFDSDMILPLYISQQKLQWVKADAATSFVTSKGYQKKTDGERKVTSSKASRRGLIVARAGARIHHSDDETAAILSRCRTETSRHKSGLWCGILQRKHG